MAPTAAEVHQLKQAQTNEDVLPVMRSRWSPRSFSNREVSSADLRRVFEAARWAPSSYNEQPWRFLVGVRGTETYQKILSSLGEFNQQWASTAPVLILGAAKKHFTRNNTPNGFNVFDLGAASGFITLEAAAIGLHTHQMAGFDKEVARKSFQIPDEFEIGSVMALGYQGEPSALKNEQMVSQETAPRTRKELSEIVFSAWETPAEFK
jgi:nitroreductase